ncbi:DUF3906 family protein [Paenibacillus sp. J31TS4]|uniref:DUF3906 family protein n=1 Tax=Paenibacillus sp. J31TS4 TaxID=2807195 RepID=UPI0027958AFB|nr:DUF3906 family protein [Paenibacillus sp. J31TS4]
MQIIYLIVAAESDDKAFAAAESQLVRHYVKAPDVRETVLVEKKRLEKGTGFVIETKPAP